MVVRLLKKGTVPPGSIGLPEKNQRLQRDSPRFQQPCRIFSGLSAAVALVLTIALSSGADDSDRESKLFAAARGAERILIAIPQHKNAAGGLVDIPPGGQFVVEIERALRGPGSKATSVLIINGGSEKLHPRYLNGKQYIFLLKKNPQGKGWINLGTSEIPIKNGKVQYLVDGKVAEEVALDEFEDFSVKDAQPVAEKIARRDSLTGKWIVATSNKGTNMFLWLVELNGKESVKLLSSSKILQAAILKSAEISGDEVHLRFEGDGSSLDFHGRFADGIVRGYVAFGRSVVNPAWMEPTELSSMRKYDSPLPDSALPEFTDATGQDNATGALGRFIRRHPNSTLALSAYQELVALAADDKLNQEKFEKLANDYLTTARHWGPGIELQATIDLGALLSRKDHLPELALEYLTAAASRLDDETPLESKKTVGIERGRRMIAAGKAAEGVAALASVREEFPFDVDVLYALARQAEKDNRIDEALELFGELHVLPQLEQALADSQKSAGRKLPVDQSPRRVLARLWTQQHGDTKGLPAWLDALYERRIKAIAADKLATRGKDDGTRVVVCELFTGATGAPAVAADVALSAMQGAATPAEMIAVRFHVNGVPGPDPLANDDTQERFKMYAGTTAAMLVVDGRFVPMTAGGMPEAPAVYRRLRTIVETNLKDQIDLSLEVSAKADKGQIAVSARALGLRNFPPNTRLQVILVEDKIDFAAGNGIRFHEMVARSMLGGPGGVAPVQGALSFTGNVDIAKLKQKLSRQMEKTEREGETPFDAKPLELQALHVVAFIQNSETADVLQAASVPVTGLAAPADRKKSDEN